MASWREDRIGSAHRGENPMVMAEMRSGFAVIGDTQHLPGYSLLLCGDASVNHLTDLDWRRRTEFLFDLSLIGEAVQLACVGTGLRRVNYEVLGNSMAWLHGHVHPRYDWEPVERLGSSVWCYPATERSDPANAYSDREHGELRSAIALGLDRLMRAAYQLGAGPADDRGPWASPGRAQSPSSTRAADGEPQWFGHAPMA